VPPSPEVVNPVFHGTDDAEVPIYHYTSMSTPVSEVILAPLKSIMTERLNSGLIDPFTFSPGPCVVSFPERHYRLNYIILPPSRKGLSVGFSRMIRARRLYERDLYDIYQNRPDSSVTWIVKYNSIRSNPKGFGNRVGDYGAWMAQPSDVRETIPKRSPSYRIEPSLMWTVFLSPGDYQIKEGPYEQYNSS
jgi:hypothetical protein